MRETLNLPRPAAWITAPRLTLLARVVPPIGVLTFYWLIIERAAFSFAGSKFFPLFDDAMISMRYARNLAEGHGLVWNVGEPPVEGFTNPLWTLWMTALHLTGIPESYVGLAVALSGVGLVVATGVTVREISRHVYPGERIIPILGFWATLLYYPLVFWSLRGMEVGLVAFLLSLSVLFSLRLRDHFAWRELAGLATVISLGLLTRMEFIVPAVLISAFTALGCPGRRGAIILAIGFVVAATLGGLTAWRLAYYGELLPNTYYLKVAGLALDERLARGIATLASSGITHLAGFLIVVAIYLANRRASVTSNEWFLLGILAFAAGYSAWVGGDAWEDYAFANRYIAPAIPLALLVGIKAAKSVFVAGNRSLAIATAVMLILGWLNLAIADSPRATPPLLRALTSLGMAAILIPAATRRFQPNVALYLVPVALLLSLSLAPVGGWLLHGAPHSDGDAAMSAYGLLLRETTAPDASIAVVWAGAASYYSQRESFDELGKTDAVIAHGPHVAETFRPGHSKWDLEYTLGELRPDVVTGLFVADARDLARIEGWGYTHLVGSCYYHSGSVRVDADRLQAGLLRLRSNPRFATYICPPAIDP